MRSPISAQLTVNLSVLIALSHASITLFAYTSVMLSLDRASITVLVKFGVQKVVKTVPRRSANALNLKITMSIGSARKGLPFLRKLFIFLVYYK